MRHLRKIGHLLIGALLSAVPAVGQEEVLTNEDVIALTASGVTSSVILVKIEHSVGRFDSSVDAILALREAGVAPEVIEAMVSARSRPSGPAEPLGAGDMFRDALRSGGEGPEMVIVPAGTFSMGCARVKIFNVGISCESHEKPLHEVRIPDPLAVGRYEVTFGEWDACVSAGACDHRPDPGTSLNASWLAERDDAWDDSARPVVDVSWRDVQEYVAWLSSETGLPYRLLSESEWEYVARAGTRTHWSWGDKQHESVWTQRGLGLANCHDCGSEWDGISAAPVGSFPASPFALHDMHGNVAEWVEDCWNKKYRGAPSDGSAWVEGNCSRRVVRGGSWGSPREGTRSGQRDRAEADERYLTVGFRVVRVFSP